MGIFSAIPDKIRHHGSSDSHAAAAPQTTGCLRSRLRSPVYRDRLQHQLRLLLPCRLLAKS